MVQATTAPSGPVAPAKVLGSEKIPAPIMPPTTMAVSCMRVILTTFEDMAGARIRMEGSG